MTKRQQDRIDQAALEVQLALNAIERYADLIERYGLTVETCGGLSPHLIHKKLNRVAERILLADVYGEVDDDLTRFVDGGEA